MEFLRTKKAELSLDMTPMIDIVFQLLIFFMLSSSFLNPALKLTLPTAVPQDKAEPQRLIVSVDKNGAVFVNTQKTAIESLKGRLQTDLVKDPKKSVHLRGDADMPYKMFVQVMDIARQAGAKQINIVHEQAGGQAAPQQNQTGAAS